MEKLSLLVCYAEHWLKLSIGESVGTEGLFAYGEIPGKEGGDHVWGYGERE